MTLDGIPETLPPVAETAERSRSRAAEPQPAASRRRMLPAVPQEEGPLDDDSQESHVLDDLA